MKYKNIFNKKTGLSFSISIIILIALISFSNPKKVWYYLSISNLRFVLIGFTLWIFSMILRNIRWRILLRRVGIEADFMTTLKSLLAGIGISNITPGKVGDPIRAYFLKKETGNKASNILPSIFIERFLDLLGLIVLGFFGAFLLYGTSYFKYFIIATGIYFVMFILFVFISISENRIKTLFFMVFRILKFVPKIREFESEIENLSRNFNRSFKKYSEPSTLFVSFLLSLIIWIIESLVVYFSFKALNTVVDLYLIIVINPVIVLVSVLTLLPGGLGTGDALSVFVYSKILGVNISQLTAMTIIARSVSFWPSVIIGVILASNIRDNRRKEI